MPRTKRTDDDWRQLIRECKSSGVSDQEWLREHHIASSTFYKKLGELYGEVEQNTPVPTKKLAEVPEVHEIVQVTFDEPVRLDSQPARTAATEASVVLRTGNFTIEISNNAGADVIRNTVLALSGLC